MYQTKFEGKHHELGTSGFLYRSNKLMYDHETESMWSTLKGEPVVGKLIDKGIKLKRRHVVTTTWGKWKSLHPDTTVLSLDTGHRRDYGEGVAYNSYFATDELMFQVPKTDDRLLNKAEVFALRNADEQVAISIDFLKKKPVHYESVGKQKIVILADSGGASRAYEAGDVAFKEFDGVTTATDSEGNKWKVAEDKVSFGDKSLIRVPSHRAFWFGWQSQFPETRLVK